MVSDRNAATLVGVLFIIGTMAGVLSLLVTDPLVNTPDYLARIAANPAQMALGALLVLVMGFALAMVPVLFYPIGRRYSEVLAMGYIVFRGALETVTYMISALGWLFLIALGRTSAAAPASFVRTAEGLIWDQVIALPFVVGAIMFYYLLYEHRLVPRWLSIWGLVGAVLYLGAPLTNMFGVTSLGALMAPLALQEMVLAVWLIAKGFSAPVRANAQ